MTRGTSHARAALLLLVGVLLLPVTAIVFGEFTFLDKENEFVGGELELVGDRIVVMTVANSASPQAWQAYAMYFQWLSERGGVMLGGRPAKVQLIVAELGPTDPVDLDMLISFVISSGTDIQAMLGSGNAVWDQDIAESCHKRSIPFISPLLAPKSALENYPTVFGAGTPADQVLGGAMRLLAEQGAQLVHTISEDSAWAQEACGAAGSFGVPAGQNITVPPAASEEAFREALSGSVLALDTSRANVLAACVATRETCQQLLNSMVALDYNVDAVVVTNCIEEDISYSVNWETPLYSWVLGADSWVPDLAASRNVTQIWDAGHFLSAYAKTYKTHIVRKEWGAALNAAWLLVRAAEATNTTDTAAWVRWLSTANEETDHGTFTFDAGGQRQVGAVTKQFVRPTQYAELVRGDEVSTVWSLTYPKPAWAMVACIGDVLDHRGLFMDESGVESCQECPITMTVRHDDEEELRKCDLCMPGRFPYWDKKQVHCVTCPPGSFNNDTESMGCTRCAPGKFQDEWEQTACVDCPEGLVAPMAGQSACVHCPKGLYSSGEDRSTCSSCPSGAICDGGTITNRGTYYLLDDGGEITASNFYKCIHGDNFGLLGEACLENESCWRDEEGRETMTGVLCGQCKEGFGKGGITGLCRKCGSMLLMWLLASLEPVLFLLMANGVVLIVLYTDFSKPKNTWSIIAKQVLSYLQMFSAMAPYLTLENNLSFVRKVLSMQEYVGLKAPTIALSSANCLSDTFFEDWTPFRLVTMTGYLYGPVLLTVTYNVFLIARCLGRPIGGDGAIVTNRKFIAVVVIYVFFLHGKTVQFFLTALDCRSIDDEKRLLLDLDVQCWGDEHRPTAIAAVVGLVLCGFGIPLFFFWVLYQYNQMMMLDDLTFKSTLGFLYAGFERRVYWFESVLMLRRITFPILVTLSHGISRGIPVSADASIEEQEEIFNLTVLMILVMSTLLFFGLHLSFQPYDNRSYFILDRIESWSLWAILNTAAAQVFLTVVEVGPALEALVFCMLLCTHSTFWALVLWGLFRRPLLEFVAGYVLPSIDSDWVTSGISWFFGGSVKVLPDGLDVHRLVGMEKESFSFLMEEIVEKHLHSFPELNFRGLVGTLQCMCIEAAHTRRIESAGGHEEVEASRPAYLIANDVASGLRKVVSGRLPDIDGGLRLGGAGQGGQGVSQAEFSKDAWQVVVSQQYRFTVEELQMAFLRLASQSWVQEDIATPEFESSRTDLVSIFREGFPQSGSPPSSDVSGAGADLSVRRANSGSSSDDAGLVGIQSFTARRLQRGSSGTTLKSSNSASAEPALARKRTWSSRLFGRRPSGVVAASATGGEEQSEVGPAAALPITPLTPVSRIQAGSQGPARDPERRRQPSRLGEGRVRTERAELMQQVKELQERNAKLELALEALAGQKETLAILVQSARDLPADNVYYVTAYIRGKEFGAKLQTHAVLLKPGQRDAEWGHEHLVHGYEGGDSLRFTVWTWGKKRTGQDVKFATMDLSGEEVAASLAAPGSSSHTVPLQLEAPVAVVEDMLRPSLEVRIARHGNTAASKDVVEGRLQNDGSPALGGEASAASPPLPPPSRGSGGLSPLRRDGPQELPPLDLKDADFLRSRAPSSSASEHEDAEEEAQAQAQAQAAEAAEPSWTFRVVPENGVKVRIAPDRAARALGYRKCGDVVQGWKVPQGVDGEWIKLEGDQGYMIWRKGEREYLVQEGGPVSKAGMVVMATPFYQPKDRTEDALRRPDEQEAGGVLERKGSSRASSASNE